ncbi:MAG: TetR/AcrR family transcriptional regulator [Bacteroidetes bacterium]|nr:TetR/AcrR family transcriptional regulator [Bacteroidota bacterium]
MADISFRVNSKLFVRDPQHTDLGQRIIKHSIDLIDKLGFEDFTFRKLADQIESTEASVYRYFENKHRLLHYLTAWYWNWLNYRIDIATNSLSDSSLRLKAAIKVITDPKIEDPRFEFVNEVALHRIVVAEMEKTYLTKWVDNDNEEGLFWGFNSLCHKLSGFINIISPGYSFANSLASTVLLATHQQLFFLIHLPGLSDMKKKDDLSVQHQQLQTFIEEMVFRTIGR